MNRIRVAGRTRGHDKSQEYFWSNEWQQKMTRSAQAIREGRVKVFENSRDRPNALGEHDADNNSD